MSIPKVAAHMPDGSTASTGAAEKLIGVVRPEGRVRRAGTARSGRRRAIHAGNRVFTLI